MNPNSFQTDLATLPFSDLLKKYGIINDKNFLSGIYLSEIYDPTTQQIHSNQISQSGQPSPAQLFSDQPQLLKSDLNHKTNQPYYYKDLIIKIEIRLNTTVIFANQPYNKLAIIGPSKWFAENNGQFIWWKAFTNFKNQIAKGGINQWFKNQIQSQLQTGANPFTMYQFQNRNGQIENVLMLNNYQNIAKTEPVPTYQPKTVAELQQSQAAALNQTNLTEQNQAQNPTNSQFSNQNQQILQSNQFQFNPNHNQIQYATNQSLAGSPQGFDQYQVQIPNDPNKL